MPSAASCTPLWPYAQRRPGFLWATSALITNEFNPSREKMKNRISRIEIFLLLAGILCLCSVSFVAGRNSWRMGMHVAQSRHGMNELDRLQQETASQRQ